MSGWVPPAGPATTLPLSRESKSSQSMGPAWLLVAKDLPVSVKLSPCEKLPDTLLIVGAPPRLTSGGEFLVVEALVVPGSRTRLPKRAAMIPATTRSLAPSVAMRRVPSWRETSCRSRRDRHRESGRVHITRSVEYVYICRTGTQVSPLQGGRDGGVRPRGWQLQLAFGAG